MNPKTPSLFILSLISTLLFAQEPPKLKITPLTDNFYIYTTYNLYKDQPYPANSMYLITNEGAVIFDTPWDTTQFQPLLDSIYSKHHQKVKLCFATHFHEDRTAGLEYYRSKGIKTFTTKMTDEFSSKKGMKRAEYLMNSDTTFKLGNYSFEVFYPGPGHAPDNMVVWFEKDQILYGGCLIKSTIDKTLGNLSDANINEYPITLKKVLDKCGQPRFIIPGHNDWSDNRSLIHTLKMANKLKNSGKH